MRDFYTVFEEREYPGKERDGVYILRKNRASYFKDGIRDVYKRQVYEQRDYIYKALTDIPGITAVKPRAAFYIFPKIDTEKFNIMDDEQCALDFLHEKQVLLVPGKGFNWGQPDHFRVVYLPNVRQLEKATDRLREFLSTYHQR